MKKRTIILFWMGWVIAAAGFTLGQANRIPFVLRTVSPSYWNATIGLKKLIKTGLLSRGDTGFDGLARIKLHDLARINSPQLMKGCRIVKFTYSPGSFTIFHNDPDGEVTGLRVVAHLSNGQSDNWNSKQIEQKVGRLKERGILFFSSAMFLLGSCIQVLSWWRNRPLASASAVHAIHPVEEREAQGKQ